MTAGGIALAVSALIWPDNSIGNYMGILGMTLGGYNQFFKEHTEAMLSTSSASLKTTLPSLHERLRSTDMLLVMCKRAVRREILFSRVNGEDISKLTRIMKELRSPLHGVGLSCILKRELLTKGTDMLSDGETSESLQQEQADLNEAIKEINALYKEISSTCQAAMLDCLARLKPLSGSPPRTAINSLLWPFPRLIKTSWFKKNSDAVSESSPMRASDLEAMVEQLDRKAGESINHLLQIHQLRKTELVGQHRLKNDSIYIMGLYRHSLREYAQRVANLLQYVEDLENTRKSRRIWLPPLHKLFWGKGDIVVDVNGSSDPGEYGQDSEGTTQHELTLIRTNTRTGFDEYEHDERDYKRASSGKLYYRDPDVEPPTTFLQKFFCALYSLGGWFFKVDTVFAFKAATGSVLLALPAYIKTSAAWYIEWRGQWALITLMLWMLPTSGMFFHS